MLTNYYGVASRVEKLADRNKSEACIQAQPFKYVLPLLEIFSEIMGCKEDSLRVKKAHAKAIFILASELDVLHNVSVKDLERYDRRHYTLRSDVNHKKINGTIYFLSATR